MARIPRIRVTSSDREEYARLARNVRSKISRTKRNYGIDLSNEINLPSSIDSFSTRSEFNRFKEQASSLTNRYNLNYQYVKNEHGVVMTKSEVLKEESNTRALQHQADREMKRVEKLPVTHKGEQYGTVADRRKHFTDPDTTGIYRPDDFNWRKVTSREHLKDIRERNERRLEPDYQFNRRSIMKDNFITKLQGSFHGEEREVVELIQQLTPDEFMDLWRSIDELDFDLYDSDGKHISATTKDIETIELQLKDYLNGKNTYNLPIDDDFDAFKD